MKLRKRVCETSLLVATAILQFSASTTLGQTIYENLPLESPGLAESTFFGTAVDISNGIIIIGSPGIPDLFPTEVGSPGATYLYDAATGQQIAQLRPADVPLHRGFGVSVGISGEVAILGVVTGDFGSGPYLEATGSAYLFDTQNGMQLNKLLPHDSGKSDSFGAAVDVSTQYAIVGSPGDRAVVPGSGEIYDGAAYIFDVNTGEELHKLTGDAGDQMFGSSVALSGNKAIVRAGDGKSSYIFDVSTGEQISKLTSGRVRTGFGRSVAIDGDTAVFTARLSAGINSGIVYVYDISSGDVVQELLPQDGTFRRDFGSSVAIDGDLVVVGASGEDFQTGAAYIFDAATGEQVSKLEGKGTESGYLFGSTVAIDGGSVVVGSNHGQTPYTTDEIGRVYVFYIPEPSSYALAAAALCLTLGTRRR